MDLALLRARISVTVSGYPVGVHDGEDCVDESTVDEKTTTRQTPNLTRNQGLSQREKADKYGQIREFPRANEIPSCIH